MSRAILGKLVVFRFSPIIIAHPEPANFVLMLLVSGSNEIRVSDFHLVENGFVFGRDTIAVSGREYPKSTTTFEKASATSMTRQKTLRMVR